jgi:hypothetical protein
MLSLSNFLTNKHANLNGKFKYYFQNMCMYFKFYTSINNFDVISVFIYSFMYMYTAVYSLACMSSDHVLVFLFPRTSQFKTVVFVSKWM